MQANKLIVLLVGIVMGGFAQAASLNDAIPESEIDPAAARIQESAADELLTLLASLEDIAPDASLLDPLMDVPAAIEKLVPPTEDLGAMAKAIVDFARAGLVDPATLFARSAVTPEFLLETLADDGTHRCFVVEPESVLVPLGTQSYLLDLDAQSGYDYRFDFDWNGSSGLVNVELKRMSGQMSTGSSGLRARIHALVKEVEPGYHEAKWMRFGLNTLDTKGFSAPDHFSLELTGPTLIDIINGGWTDSSQDLSASIEFQGQSGPHEPSSFELATVFADHVTDDGEHEIDIAVSEQFGLEEPVTRCNIGADDVALDVEAAFDETPEEVQINFSATAAGPVIVNPGPQPSLDNKVKFSGSVGLDVRMLRARTEVVATEVTVFKQGFPQDAPPLPGGPAQQGKGKHDSTARFELIDLPASQGDMAPTIRLLLDADSYHEPATTGEDNGNLVGGTVDVNLWAEDANAQQLFDQIVTVDATLYSDLPDDLICSSCPTREPTHTTLATGAVTMPVSLSMELLKEHIVANLSVHEPVQIDFRSAVLKVPDGAVDPVLSQTGISAHLRGVDFILHRGPENPIERLPRTGEAALVDSLRVTGEYLRDLDIYHYKFWDSGSPTYAPAYDPLDASYPDGQDFSIPESDYFPFDLGNDSQVDVRLGQNNGFLSRKGVVLSARLTLPEIHSLEVLGGDPDYLNGAARLQWNIGRTPADLGIRYRRYADKHYVTDADVHQPAWAKWANTRIQVETETFPAQGWIETQEQFARFVLVDLVNQPSFPDKQLVNNTVGKHLISWRNTLQWQTLTPFDFRLWGLSYPAGTGPVTPSKRHGKRTGYDLHIGEVQNRALYPRGWICLPRAGGGKQNAPTIFQRNGNTTHVWRVPYRSLQDACMTSKQDQETVAFSGLPLAPKRESFPVLGAAMQVYKPTSLSGHFESRDDDDKVTNRTDIDLGTIGSLAMTLGMDKKTMLRTAAWSDITTRHRPPYRTGQEPIRGLAQTVNGSVTVDNYVKVDADDPFDTKTKKRPQVKLDIELDNYSTEWYRAAGNMKAKIDWAAIGFGGVAMPILFGLIDNEAILNLRFEDHEYGNEWSFPNSATSVACNGSSIRVEAWAVTSYITGSLRPLICP